MKIDNIKDLKAVIKLCRDTGVSSIKVDNVEFHLGHEPIKYKASSKQTTSTYTPSESFVPGGVTEDVKIVTDELTPEQLLMWSTGETSDQQ